MWDKLQIFGFQALWNPLTLVITILLGVLYYLFTGPFKEKAGLKESPSGKQQVFLYSALALFYLIKGAPLYIMSHIFLSVHMLQMVIFYFIIPMLVIKGIPEQWWRKVFGARVIGPLINFMTKPLVAIVIFHAMFSFYHLPTVLDFSKTNNFVHWSITLAIFVGAFCFWWPLMTPFKERVLIKPLYKIFYIFGSGLLITPSCALIIFADSPLYATYSEPDAFMQALALCVPLDVLQGLNLGGPQIFMNMNLVHDQQAAGILMKVSQEFIYGGVLAALFYNWYNSENRRGIDPLPSTQQSITPERG